MICNLPVKKIGMDIKNPPTAQVCKLLPIVLNPFGVKGPCIWVIGVVFVVFPLFVLFPGTGGGITPLAELTAVAVTTPVAVVAVAPVFGDIFNKVVIRGPPFAKITYFTFVWDGHSTQQLSKMLRYAYIAYAFHVFFLNFEFGDNNNNVKQT
uniref:Uncharacterized protein n=1 Tax=Glossina pallidipes TaxID=7398 RepID=A0A1B0A060_GLOPL